jgi:hypothetical protein
MVEKSGFTTPRPGRFPTPPSTHVDIEIARVMKEIPEYEVVISGIQELHGANLQTIVEIRRFLQAKVNELVKANFKTAEEKASIKNLLLSTRNSIEAYLVVRREITLKDYVESSKSEESAKKSNPPKRRSGAAKIAIGSIRAPAIVKRSGIRETEKGRRERIETKKGIPKIAG